jgi:thioredoxin 1
MYGFGQMAPARALPITALLTALVMAVTPARSSEPNIYPEAAQAKIDLNAALAASAASHKRVILDFGGNWCPDCHVLDRYFHDSTNQPILDANYILVYINIGRMNENLDIAERYRIPLRKGVPALAVLGERGELLFSQQTGEFEAMHRMQSSAVTEFLVRWQRPSA